MISVGFRRPSSDRNELRLNVHAPALVQPHFDPPRSNLNKQTITEESSYENHSVF